MIITLQLSMTIATMEEDFVGVCVRLNQVMRKKFPKHHHLYVALNFQRPGKILQDWIIICWLDVAVDWYQ